YRKELRGQLAARQGPSARSGLPYRQPDLLLPSAPPRRGFRGRLSVEIWQIPGPWPGRLAVCARPRASWFLEDDVSALLDAGFTTLVSGLTDEEVIRAELERVPAIARAAGLRFDHFPVGNLQVPD